MRKPKQIVEVPRLIMSARRSPMSDPIYFDLGLPDLKRQCALMLRAADLLSVADGANVNASRAMLSDLYAYATGEIDRELTIGLLNGRDTP